MQGHKKLIPELKLNDNLRKLRGGVTPTPTPTDSNVHIYYIEANMVDNYNSYDCTINDGGELYNQVLADYQQYGNEHLYILKVKSIYPNNSWNIYNYFIKLFHDDHNTIGMYVFSEEEADVVDISINKNRIYIQYYTNSSYDHTTVEITDQNELYVYEAEQEDRDPVEYLINAIVSYYGVNTCIMLQTPEIPFCTLNQTCHFMDGSKQVYQICGYFNGGLITLTLSNDNGTYDWSLV